MKFSDLAYTAIYINLARREDRRINTEYLLDLNGIKAQRHYGISASWVDDARGFQNKERYACSLAKRMAIRRGLIRGNGAVLMFEDDIVFHKNFIERIHLLKIPEDWDLFYLGCRHLEKPITCSPGVVKCTQATDNHAILIHRKCARKVIKALSGYGRGSPPSIMYSDLQLSLLHNDLNAYAAYPNLVWQGHSHSDTSGYELSHYNDEGEQIIPPSGFGSRGLVEIR